LEYFSKWIEAKALVKITFGTLISFVWERIICHFGVPSYITVDNRKQFDCTEFRNFCSEWGIKIAFASVNHPESNGAVERANGLIFSLVSKALFDLPKGKWPQEIITAVWGHNISRTRTTGFTPFACDMAKKPSRQKELKLGSFRTQIAATTPI
jgi:transposase InsO family protein